MIAKSSAKISITYISFLLIDNNTRYLNIYCKGHITFLSNCSAHKCVSVSDNGPGVSDFIKDKCFQLFFTTKPAGQGTGLGLSLSYYIVKAHVGNLSVKSNKIEGTTFTVQIPIT